jgi:hypothetical protein
MSTVKLEVDTESGEHSRANRDARPLAAEKVGLLSSIPLSQDLIDTFESGLVIAGIDKELNSGYKKPDIKDKKEILKGKGNKVIATVGGSVVFAALSELPVTAVPPFVSLMGSVPPSQQLPVLGNCRGGVSLESYKLDKTRKDYLIPLGGGTIHSDASICLLTNMNSAMHDIEKTTWNYASRNNA